MKARRFVGSSLDLKDFPGEVRRAAGFDLFAIPHGLMPSDFEPILQVEAGTDEIRLHVLGEWRVIDVAKIADAVHVLHAVQKKDDRTAIEIRGERENGRRGRAGSMVGHRVSRASLRRISAWRSDRNIDSPYWSYRSLSEATNSISQSVLAFASAASRVPAMSAKTSEAVA
jgi:phage-related protein